jgi:hypothetical protein
MIGASISTRLEASCVFKSCRYTVSQSMTGEAKRTTPGIADRANELDRQFIRYASTNEGVSLRRESRREGAARALLPQIAWPEAMALCWGYQQRGR